MSTAYGQGYFCTIWHAITLSLSDMQCSCFQHTKLIFISGSAWLNRYEYNHNIQISRYKKTSLIIPKGRRILTKKLFSKAEESLLRSAAAFGCLLS